MYQSEIRKLYYKDTKLISAWELQVYKCICQCTSPQELYVKKKTTTQNPTENQNKELPELPWHKCTTYVTLLK